MENRPTAHGARAHWRTWRGCLCSQRRARSIPRCWPRLHFSASLARSGAAASNLRDHSIRNPCQAARARFAMWRTGRPPTEHERACGVGVVVFTANAERSPSHAVGRGSTSTELCHATAQASHLREHSFRSPCRAARARVAPWRTGQPSIEHARWRTLRGCLCSQRRARSTPHRVPRVLITDTAPSRRLRLRNAVT